MTVWTYHPSMLHGWQPFDETSLPDVPAFPDVWFHWGSTPHSPSLLLPECAMPHWCPETKQHNLVLQILFKSDKCFISYNEKGSLSFKRTDKKSVKFPHSNTRVEHEVCLHTYRHHSSLWRHEGGSVAESEFSLQSVKTDLQLAFLLNLQTTRTH